MHPIAFKSYTIVELKNNGFWKAKFRERRRMKGSGKLHLMLIDATELNLVASESIL